MLSRGYVDQMWECSLFRASHSRALSKAPSPPPPPNPRPSLPPLQSWKLCCRIPSAQPLGEEHKTQVPKAIIKLPEPFLLLLNLLVANPANNTLGWPSVKVIITAAGLLGEREGTNKTGSLWKLCGNITSLAGLGLSAVCWEKEMRTAVHHYQQIGTYWLYSKHPSIHICYVAEVWFCL